MPKHPGNTDITSAEQGVIVYADRVYKHFNCETSRRLNLTESTVRNAKKRVYAEADKQHISPLEAANTKRPRGFKPDKKSPRDRRRLVRHASKSEASRRKSWAKIAQEVGIDASYTAISRAFDKAGYSRHPLRRTPHDRAQQACQEKGKDS